MPCAKNVLHAAQQSPAASAASCRAGLLVTTTVNQPFSLASFRMPAQGARRATDVGVCQYCMPFQSPFPRKRTFSDSPSRTSGTLCPLTPLQAPSRPARQPVGPPLRPSHTGAGHKAGDHDGSPSAPRGSASVGAPGGEPRVLRHEAEVGGDDAPERDAEVPHEGVGEGGGRRHDDRRPLAPGPHQALQGLLPPVGRRAAPGLGGGA